MEQHIIALDGEGYTLADGSHRYTYLAAADAEGMSWDIENLLGITTHEALDFLLSLPPKALLVGYSLGYDRTKWLEHVPNGILWALDHPDSRLGEHGPKPVRWREYSLNLVSTKFTLKSEGQSRTVWDVFKFFQAPFVKALETWKVGTAKELEHIARMKAQRGNFSAIGSEEQQYCRSECRLLAKLVAELLQAHEQEDLHLRQFFGPGSTARLIMARCDAQSHNADLPSEMVGPVQCAFFGGRFECSHVGPIEPDERGLYSYDIASAYPYALAQLPCMRPDHGGWKHLTARAYEALKKRDVCLVSYRLNPIAGEMPWGPLPHRLPDGNIVFPTSGAGGWVWSEEAEQARSMHRGFEVLEAWQWKRSCACPPPFREQVTQLFTRRLAWGKGARGLVLKLGLNSMYGVSAQSVGGGGKYRCMVRAGLITSLTRALLLQAIARARDPWDVLELATDSILVRGALSLPDPLDLGQPASDEKKLGQWERKALPHGVMLLRPGLRFELGQNADMRNTAARGIGTRVLHANRAMVLRAWEREPMAPTTVQQPAMFHGSKSSVRAIANQAITFKDGTHPVTFSRGELYGRWQEPSPKNLSYAPGPKRDGVVLGLDGTIRMLPWALPLDASARSAPYRAEGEDFERIQRDEQPEAGLDSPF